ncbi:MAG TPA: GAF domain-containing protein [Gaiellaceae bacterium]|nr:GAF domain-containing protein [Gaiellaceae bacterium]
MRQLESLILGLDGLALAWESVAVVLGALVLGLGLGLLARARSTRRQPPVGPRHAEQAREVETLRRLAAELARTPDVEGVARTLLDEVGSLFDVGFVGLTFVSEDGREASGFLARAEGRDVEWWPDVRLDLVREPSGIASAAFEATSFAVYDVTGSTRVSSRLASEVGAKSAAFVPLVSGDRVIAVISVATTDDFRAFSSDDLSLMQTLASEATIALERTRSSLALGEALDRERLLALLGRRLRSELELAPALAAAVEETGQALRAIRCFVRVGDVMERWAADGAPPPASPADLPVTNLAERDGRTVTVTDIQDGGSLAEPGLAPLDDERAQGAHAVISTPVVVQGQVVGALTAARGERRPWTQSEVALLEAVAAEIALAVRLDTLLTENRERLTQQTALLRAAQVLTGELDLRAVLERLVVEVAGLLDADASDCYLYDRERGVLRCAALHGFDESLVGFEFPATRGLAGVAIREGRAVTGSDYGQLAERVPTTAYEGFTDALVAPMRWSDEVQGVLGVGRRSGVPFTRRDAGVLEAFAGLASLALRNAETYTRSSRQARVQRGFYRIASVLGQSLSRSATLDAVAQAAAEALGGAAAAVLMPAGRRLVLAGRYQLDAAFADAVRDGIETGDGPLARAAAQARVIAAPALVEDERIPESWRTAAGSGGYRALLAVPVDSPRDEGRGVVSVLFTEERVFTDDDLELARHLADATRGALERSELFEAERSARALAQQLTRTGRLITSELDPAAVLDEVVQQAPELVRADACAIRVLEEDELVVNAAVGLGSEAALGSRAPASSLLSGDVVQSRAPVAIEDAAADARYRSVDPVLAAGHAAYLGVPLAGPEGLPLGVLAVYATEPRPWREEEVDAMLALAASTSAALSNAELYQRVALEKERSFAILANIADGIVAVDRDGRVVVWNAAAERITGVPAAEALGRSPAQLLQRDLESESGVTNRLVSITRGGEQIWLSLSEAVMRDPSGAVAGRIFAFRDISSEWAVEQMKSDFVSTVSHELRTPLTSIYGFAETLMRRDVEFDERDRSVFLGYIATESERLTRIVDTLLNVARLDTGDLEVELEPTDVGALVADAVGSLHETAANGHSFVLDLDDGSLEVQADPDKLRQVVDQLVENAIKYSPGGGVVRIEARRRPHAVEVSVVDEGIGIPVAHRERIFDKFYRVGDTVTGTGLGLFIARGLVSAMGGRIRVDSEEGRGSRFTFELPVGADE